MEGEEAVSISSEILHQKIKECEELAIGYVVGHKLSYSMVKEATTKVWKTISEFLNSEDRNLALDHGEMKSIPVWVLIYNVPLHLWKNLALGPIASFVGKPLMMVDCTINKTRLSYARVLVEVSFECQSPSFIPLWIDGKFVMNLPVEYQWKPQKCMVCHSFGHSNNKCYLKKASIGKSHWTSRKRPNLGERIKPLSKEGETGNTGTENREQIKEHSIVDSLTVTEDKEATVPQTKNSGRKKNGPNAYLSPFTLLESEPESGFDDSNDELPDTLNEDSRVGIDVEETGVEKLKLLEDVSHFKPMNREQHIKKVKNFSNLLYEGGKENAVENIFEGLVDRHRSTKSEKEIAKLAWNGVTSNENLGRGKRTPVKKKY
ncbi:hypothetical protein C5167_017984 [Papaver somniferum]|uniref:Uncharacterized protein n=1 Tax=Papaver somniferum TaxID=3469 RepID=A0A4Y7IKY5_PAPSO|nr:hypothetical protein C5167_017984 [Papaver somniferum]